MASREMIRKRLEFWNERHEKLQKAYIDLVDGRAQKYKIDDREITRFNIGELEDQIEKAEDKIDELTAALNGKRPRKAFGVFPQDW